MHRTYERASGHAHGHRRPRRLARRLVRDECRRRLDGGRSSGADAPQALVQATSADLAAGSPSAAVLVFGLRGLLARTERVSACMSRRRGWRRCSPGSRASEAYCSLAELRRPLVPEERPRPPDHSPGARRTLQEACPWALAGSPFETRRLAPPAQDEVEGSQARTPNGNPRWPQNPIAWLALVTASRQRRRNGGVVVLKQIASGSIRAVSVPAPLVGAG